MNKALSRLLTLSLTLMLALVSAYGQSHSALDGSTPTGMAPGSPAGSYALSRFDNVNPFNGHLNFSLPLLQAAGRGETRMPVVLNVDQKWFIEQVFDGSTNYYYPRADWWFDNPAPVFNPGHMKARAIGERDKLCTLGPDRYTYAQDTHAFDLHLSRRHGV